MALSDTAPPPQDAAQFAPPVQNHQTVFEGIDRDIVAFAIQACGRLASTGKLMENEVPLTAIGMCSTWSIHLLPCLAAISFDQLSMFLAPHLNTDGKWRASVLKPIDFHIVNGLPLCSGMSAGHPTFPQGQTLHSPALAQS